MHNYSAMKTFLSLVKFMFSKKATKIVEIFTIDLTLCSKCQSDGEDFFNFCGPLTKHELYSKTNKQQTPYCTDLYVEAARRYLAPKKIKKVRLSVGGS